MTTGSRSLEEELQQAEEAALATIRAAADAPTLERLKADVLGKKSAIRQLQRRLGELPADQRPAAGQIINAAQERVELELEGRLQGLRQEELARRLESEKVDVTLPGLTAPLGVRHPLSLVLEEILRVFTS